MEGGRESVMKRECDGGRKTGKERREGERQWVLNAYLIFYVMHEG